MQWKSACGAASLANVVLLASTSAFAQPIAAQSENTVEYNLPAQDLSDTLEAIARLSGQQVVFASDAVRGLKAPPVKGHLRFVDAIRTALTGTNLVVEYRAGAALVHERTAAPAAEAVAAANPAITVTGTRIRGVGSTSPVTVTSRSSACAGDSAAARRVMQIRMRRIEPPI